MFFCTFKKTCLPCIFIACCLIRQLAWQSQYTIVTCRLPPQKKRLGTRQYRSTKFDDRWFDFKSSSAVLCEGKQVSRISIWIGPEKFHATTSRVLINILQYYSCVSCSKRLQTSPDSVMTKCDNCQVRFLLANSTKTITARICIKAADEQLQWFLLSHSALEDIVANHANNPFVHLESFDDEKLSEIILLTSSMKLLTIPMLLTMYRLIELIVTFVSKAVEKYFFKNFFMFTVVIHSPYANVRASWSSCQICCS